MLKTITITLDVPSWITEGLKSEDQLTNDKAYKELGKWTNFCSAMMYVYTRCKNENVEIKFKVVDATLTKVAASFTISEKNIDMSALSLLGEALTYNSNHVDIVIDH